jgi:hypothetical protein
VVVSDYVRLSPDERPRRSPVGCLSRFRLSWEAALELTEIGIAQAVIGLLIVLAGSTNSAFFFLIVSTLLEGSAAILLPALGGSSIPPGQFALLFVFLRIIAPTGGLYGYFPDAVRANAWLLCFCLYGIAMSYIGPRLFAGSINVFPMRPDPALGLFYTTPLRPTSQNLTGGIYMLGTLLMALAACAPRRGGPHAGFRNDFRRLVLHPVGPRRYRDAGNAARGAVRDLPQW